MFANEKNTKKFFDALRTVYDPTSTGSSPLMDLDGEPLWTEKKQTLDRWAEHFKSLQNRQSNIDETIDQLPQLGIKATLALELTPAETLQSIKALSSGKAAGPDTIPAEVYKYGGTPVDKVIQQHAA